MQFLHSQFVALSKREPQVLNQKASHDFESLKTTFQFQRQQNTAEENRIYEHSIFYDFHLDQARSISILFGEGLIALKLKLLNKNFD